MKENETGKYIHRFLDVIKITLYEYWNFSRTLEFGIDIVWITHAHTFWRIISSKILIPMDWTMKDENKNKKTNKFFSITTNKNYNAKERIYTKRHTFGGIQLQLQSKKENKKKR